MTGVSTPTASAIRQAVEERARIDGRALAAFRISLGLLVLLDLALRSRDLVVFYTDEGVVTRSVLAELYPIHPGLSMHALSGDVWFQVLLFLLAGGVAVALTVGYRTRLATALSLVFLLSLHARNPTILNSGDVLLRRLLFWSVFLPLGMRWSLDATRVGETRAEETRTSVANLASLALLTQVVLVYTTNAVFKLDSEVWLAGEAVGHALELDRYSVLLGPVLADLEPVLVALDWFWIALLLASPLLLVTTGWARGALAALFVAVHAGMALTMDLGIFPLVSIAALLVFLPTPAWNRIDDVVRQSSFDRFPARRSSADHDGSFVSLGTIAGRDHRVRPAIHGSLLLLLLLSNAVGIGLLDAPDGAPEELSDTSWTMFARPPTAESWIVAEGHLASGRTVDVLHGGPVRLARPPDIDGYPYARWRKHLSHYRQASPLHGALADYLCRQWNGEDETTLESIRVRRVWAPIEPEAHGDRGSRELGQYRCEGERAIRASSNAEE